MEEDKTILVITKEPALNVCLGILHDLPNLSSPLMQPDYSSCEDTAYVWMMAHDKMNLKAEVTNISHFESLTQQQEIIFWHQLHSEWGFNSITWKCWLLKAWFISPCFDTTINFTMIFKGICKTITHLLGLGLRSMTTFITFCPLTHPRDHYHWGMPATQQSVVTKPVSR